MQSCFFLMAWHYSKVTSEMEQWLCVCVLTRLEIKDEDRHASCARRKRTFLRAFSEMRNIEEKLRKMPKRMRGFQEKESLFFFWGLFVGPGQKLNKGWSNLCGIWFSDLSWAKPINLPHYVCSPGPTKEMIMWYSCTARPVRGIWGTPLFI